MDANDMRLTSTEGFMLPDNFNVDSFHASIDRELTKLEQKNLWRMSLDSIENLRTEFDEFHRYYLAHVYEYMLSGLPNQQIESLRSLQQHYTFDERFKKEYHRLENFRYKARNGSFRSKEPWCGK
jgi:hypothetical protein